MTKSNINMFLNTLAKAAMIVFCLLTLTISYGQQSGAAVLLIDMDRKMGAVNENLYGQFLEHINHSVVDGLYAEKVRGQGFEDKDFETYWKVKGTEKQISVSTLPFKTGKVSVQFNDKAKASLSQNRIYLKQGQKYNGSLWAKTLSNKATLYLRVRDPKTGLVAEIKKEMRKGDWKEYGYDFTSQVTTPEGELEIAVSGNILLDFISLMDADERKNGMMREICFSRLRI